MVPGYNTNITQGEIVFHVQTEDLGEKNPCILTLVYRGGEVVSRQTLDYLEALGPQASPNRIRSLMESQHRQTLKRIAEGGLQPPASPSPEPRNPPSSKALPQSVDQLIEAYLRRRRRKATH